MTEYPYHLSITTSTSPLYEEMQRGNTDAVCILGFADAISSSYDFNTYQVFDINEAFSIFSGDDDNDSTLLKGLIEVYTSGCRDIYLFPIGTMGEYVAPDDRDEAFWSSLATKYTNALRMLEEVDDIDIIVPYDIDIEEGDFVTLFSNHCSSVTGPLLRMAYFPYNGDPTNTFDGETYHIVYINGIGLFSFPDHFDTTYESNMASSFAGLVSSLDANVPPDNRVLKCPITFSSDYLGDEETLEANKVVGFRTTVKYERTRDGSLVSTLSYTRASDESDFKALYTTHLIQKFMRGIERLDLIGSAGHSAVDSLNNYFSIWTTNGFVKDIDASYKWREHDLLVDLLIHMYYPIGDVSIYLEIGPIL